MRWVGIDEAGYGPNLGPLVMTAVVAEGPRDREPDVWGDLPSSASRAGGPPDRLWVDDSKKNMEKPPAVRASIRLEWTPPHRAAEVIPQHSLSPNLLPETFVVTTPFPPDDRSVGYERGTSVSKAWDQAATDAAIEVTAHVADHLDVLSGVRKEAPDREQRLREFCRQFAGRAFRRPSSAPKAKPSWLRAV